MNPSSLFPQSPRLWVLLACCALGLQGAMAQTFKMPCVVEGVIAALEDQKIPSEKIDVEIQTMGKNIFLKTNGSKFYQVTASSLTTEDFVGKNLNSAKQLEIFCIYF
jgi:hypothetical protein